MPLIVVLKSHAYLDPGSGSLLLQIILGSLLAIGVAIRIFWKKIDSFINKILGREQPSPDDDQE